MEIVKYTLRNKESGKFVHVESSSNEGSYCCGSDTYRLTEYEGDDLWMLDNIKDVYYVLHNSNEWYNAASIVTPNHNLDPGEWKVVKYVQTVVVTEEHNDLYESINDRTIEEFIRTEYNKPCYHNDTTSIDSMVENYALRRGDMCKHDMFPKYVEYLRGINKEKTNHET